MEQTTNGEFRVHPGREEGELLLLDPGTADPTYVPKEGPAADLAPGNRVRATLAWGDGGARIEEATVVSDTRYRFYRTEETIFEVARDCWERARAAGEGMNARVTRGTGGDVNGVVYTFAAQPGQRDLFAEFRDGAKPLEPLLDRLRGDEDGEDSAGEDPVDRSPPYSVFVIDPADEPFVVVAIALDPDGRFARTLRATYGDASLADLGDLGDGADGPDGPAGDAGSGFDPSDYEDRFEFGG